MLGNLDAAWACALPCARELGHSEEQVRFHIESAVYIWLRKRRATEHCCLT